MIQQTQTFIPSSNYPFEKFNNLTNFLFLDIETTGFSRKYNTIYLIGCAYFQDNEWYLIQWFAQTPNEEYLILEKFIDFAKNYSGFIHFNGQRFDIPFIQARIAYLGLSIQLPNYQELDFYQVAYNYRLIFNLSNCKQKTIEQFLKITRKDLYTGGELIPIYESYTVTQEDSNLGLLLLHNADDVIGLVNLMDLLLFKDFLESTFTFDNITKEDTYFICSYTSDICLPRPLNYNINDWKIRTNKNCLHLMVPLFQEEMKHYYPQTTDYYYLPHEDQAIHKSLACFVEKEYRKKATKQTCYLRKYGDFFPIPKQLDSVDFKPIFKRTYKDKEFFALYSADVWQKPQATVNYLTAILHSK